MRGDQASPVKRDYDDRQGQNKIELDLFTQIRVLKNVLRINSTLWDSEGHSYLCTGCS